MKTKLFFIALTASMCAVSSCQKTDLKSYEKIVPPGLSDEMRAARLAGLFLVVEVVTNHYVLKLFNQFYGGGGIGGSSSSHLY